MHDFPMPSLDVLFEQAHLQFQCQTLLTTGDTEDRFDWFILERASTVYQIVKVNYWIAGAPLPKTVIMPGDLEDLYTNARLKISSLLSRQAYVQVIAITSPNGKVVDHVCDQYLQQIRNIQDPTANLRTVAGFGRF